MYVFFRRRRPSSASASRTQSARVRYAVFLSVSWQSQDTMRAICQASGLARRQRRECRMQMLRISLSVSVFMCVGRWVRLAAPWSGSPETGRPQWPTQGTVRGMLPDAAFRCLVGRLIEQP